MTVENDSLKSVASKAPHWAALVIVVGSFLFYMERSNRLNDRVAVQRIDTCHTVQRDTSEVLRQLNNTLQAAAREDAALRITISEFQKTLDRHTAAVEKLLAKMEYPVNNAR